ncbi:MAG: hypothetical protein ACRDPH_03125 [Marmoricola sp.]
MSDYRAESPVWVRGVLVTPEYLGLSAGLARALREWEQYFEDHFDDERGWDSQPASDWYRTQAEVLVRSLRAELDPRVELSVDLRPLESAAPEPI